MSPTGPRGRKAVGNNLDRLMRSLLHWVESLAVADSSLSPREIFQQRIPLDDEMWMISTVSREEIDEGRSAESGKCLDFGRVAVAGRMVGELGV